ncbi:3-hydroxyacyl-ACP dehydratase FabZ family protein [Streptosporangium algeriense]|uniref:3-hydroxyacyl-ACP dehydratase FabZ family protein n=1 Tax=Streptosporangium algeriense TaxID=1682748 RepID=A0ABW3E577_9ACTN
MNTANGTEAGSPATSRTPRTLGFTELKRWLRHRHPMIYLDRVLDYEPGEFLQSLLLVSGQTDTIAGHFPERAIYPASHLTQAFAQSGIVLFQLSTTPLADDELTLIGAVQSRFVKIVVPGDVVRFDVTAESIRHRLFTFSARASVAGVPVAQFRGTLVRVGVADLGEQLW